MAGTTLPGATYPVPPPLIRMPIIDLKTGGFNPVGTELFMEIWAAIGGGGGAIALIKELQAEVATIFGMHGDGTLSSDGVLTVTGTQGQPFGYFATGTDASHLTGVAPPSVIPIATTTDLGGVIPDGTTITVDPDGTIHSSGGGGSGTVTNVATGAGLTGGPITTTGTISFATIADDLILANISGGTAVPIANTLTAILDSIVGNTRGDLLYRGASAWAALAPGATANLPLVTGGSGADPSWATNVNVPGWLNVGATGAPTNTTAGDLSAKRLAVGDTSFAFGAARETAYVIGTMAQTAAGTEVMLRLLGTASPAGNSAAQFRNINAGMQIDAAGINFTASDYAAAVYSEARILNAGNITPALHGVHSIGLVAAGTALSLGAVAEACAYWAQPVQSFGGNGLTSVIGKAFGFRVDDSVKGTLTLTGQAGLVISPLSAATNNTSVLLGTSTVPNGNHGIWQADTNTNALAGNLTVGAAAAPGTSLVLDVNSTTGAFAPPRMTTTQRLALTPSNGMLVYDTSLSQFYKYEAGLWSPFTTITTSLYYADGSVPAGNTVANTTTETTITSQINFPAGELQVGDVVTVRLAGVYSTILTPNLTIKIKLGGTTLVSTGTFATTAALSNAGWDIEATFICTAAGTSGKFECQGVGQFGTGVASGVVVPMTNTAPIAINTSIGNVMTVTFQWGTASASDTITCREMTVWLDGSAGSSGRGATGYGGPAGGVQSAIAHATKGYLIDPQTPFFIYGGFSLITWATPQAYQFGLYSLNSSFTIQSVLSTVTVTPVSGTLQIVSFTFPSPQLLSPGTLYAMACTRTGGTTTAVLNIQGAGTDIIGMPASAHNLALYMDSINPGIGNTFTSNAAPFVIQLAWST